MDRGVLKLGLKLLIKHHDVNYTGYINFILNNQQKMLVSTRPTSDIFLQFSFSCTGFFKIKLQSRTHSMGHTPLVPPFPFPVLLYNGFLVHLSISRSTLEGRGKRTWNTTC